MTGVLHTRRADIRVDDLLRSCARVAKERPQHHLETASNFSRRVTAEALRRMRRSGWYVVRGVNEPWAGWTVEEDVREEMAALGELAVMRRVG